MNADAQRRVKQIDERLKELSEMSLTPGLTKSQRNDISREVLGLLKERADLDDNRNHWLAETQPSMGDVVAIVKREIGAQRTVKY